MPIITEDVLKSYGSHAKTNREHGLSVDPYYTLYANSGANSNYTGYLAPNYGAFNYDQLEYTKMPFNDPANYSNLDWSILEDKNVDKNKFIRNWKLSNTGLQRPLPSTRLPFRYGKAEDYTPDKVQMGWRQGSLVIANDELYRVYGWNPDGSPRDVETVPIAKRLPEGEWKPYQYQVPTDRQIAGAVTNLYKDAKSLFTGKKEKKETSTMEEIFTEEARAYKPDDLKHKTLAQKGDKFFESIADAFWKVPTAATQLLNDDPFGSDKAKDKYIYATSFDQHRRNPFGETSGDAAQAFGNIIGEVGKMLLGGVALKGVSALAGGASNMPGWLGATINAAKTGAATGAAVTLPTVPETLAQVSTGEMTPGQAAKQIAVDYALNAVSIAGNVALLPNLVRASKEGRKLAAAGLAAANIGIEGGAQAGSMAAYSDMYSDRNSAKEQLYEFAAPADLTLKEQLQNGLPSFIVGLVLPMMETGASYRQGARVASKVKKAFNEPSKPNAKPPAEVKGEEAKPQDSKPEPKAAEPEPKVVSPEETTSKVTSIEKEATSLADQVIARMTDATEGRQDLLTEIDKYKDADKASAESWLERWGYRSRALKDLILERLGIQTADDASKFLTLSLRSNDFATVVETFARDAGKSEDYQKLIKRLETFKKTHASIRKVGESLGINDNENISVVLKITPDGRPAMTILDKQTGIKTYLDHGGRAQFDKPEDQEVFEQIISNKPIKDVTDEDWLSIPSIRDWNNGRQPIQTNEMTAPPTTKITDVNQGEPNATDRIPEQAMVEQPIGRPDQPAIETAGGTAIPRGIEGEQPVETNQGVPETNAVKAEGEQPVEGEQGATAGETQVSAVVENVPHKHQFRKAKSIDDVPPEVRPYIKYKPGDTQQHNAMGTVPWEGDAKRQPKNFKLSDDGKFWIETKKYYEAEIPNDVLYDVLPPGNKYSIGGKDYFIAEYGTERDIPLKYRYDEKLRPEEATVYNILDQNGKVVDIPDIEDVALTSEEQALDALKNYLGEEQPTTKQAEPDELKKAPDVDKVAEVKATEQEVKNEAEIVAGGDGVKAQGIKDLYTIGRTLFGLNRVESLAQAIATDSVIGAMADNTGRTKADIYKEITWKKSVLSELSERGKKLYQIIGENARLQRQVRDALDIAKLAYEEGRDPKNVYLVTGWEKGIDGKWRYDFPDILPAGFFDAVKQMKVTPPRDFGSNVRSLDYFENRNFYEGTGGDWPLLDMYPRLRDITLRKVDDPSDDYAALYSPTYKEITLNLAHIENDKDLMSDMIHELQHAIQDLEGWPKGAAVSTSNIAHIDDKLANNLLDRLYFYQIARFGEIERMYSDGAITAAEYRKAEEDIRNTRRLLYSSNLNAKKAYLLEKIKDDKEELAEIYYRVAGEVEAHNTEARLLMSPQERAFTPISETEAYARDEQIILYYQDEALEQVTGKGKEVVARGAMQAFKDGSTIIHALTDPNVSTPLHEISHVYAMHMPDAEKQAVLRWTGQDKWNTKTHEAFARGMERHLAEGKTNAPGMHKIFEKFKTWLLNIYGDLEKSKIGFTLNDEMKAIYDKMLSYREPGITPGKTTGKIATADQVKAGDRLSVAHSSKMDEGKIAKTIIVGKVYDDRITYNKVIEPDGNITTLSKSQSVRFDSGRLMPAKQADVPEGELVDTDAMPGDVIMLKDREGNFTKPAKVISKTSENYANTKKKDLHNVQMLENGVTSTVHLGSETPTGRGYRVIKQNKALQEEADVTPTQTIKNKKSPVVAPVSKPSPESAPTLSKGELASKSGVYKASKGDLTKVIEGDRVIYKTKDGTPDVFEVVKSDDEGFNIQSENFPKEKYYVDKEVLPKGMSLAKRTLNPDGTKAHSSELPKLDKEELDKIEPDEEETTLYQMDEPSDLRIGAARIANKTADAAGVAYKRINDAVRNVAIGRANKAADPNLKIDDRIRKLSENNKTSLTNDDWQNLDRLVKDLPEEKRETAHQEIKEIVEGIDLKHKGVWGINFVQSRGPLMEKLVQKIVKHQDDARLVVRTDFDKSMEKAFKMVSAIKSDENKAKLSEREIMGIVGYTRDSFYSDNLKIRAEADETSLSDMARNNEEYQDYKDQYEQLKKTSKKLKAEFADAKGDKEKRAGLKKAIKDNIAEKKELASLKKAVYEEIKSEHKVKKEELNSRIDANLTPEAIKARLRKTAEDLYDVKDMSDRELEHYYKLYEQVADASNKATIQERDNHLRQNGMLDPQKAIESLPEKKARLKAIKSEEDDALAEEDVSKMRALQQEKADLVKDIQAIETAVSIAEDSPRMQHFTGRWSEAKRNKRYGVAVHEVYQKEVTDKQGNVKILTERVPTSKDPYDVMKYFATARERDDYVEELQKQFDWRTPEGGVEGSYRVGNVDGRKTTFKVEKFIDLDEDSKYRREAINSTKRKILYMLSTNSFDDKNKQSLLKAIDEYSAQLSEKYLDLDRANEYDNVDMKQLSDTFKYMRGMKRQIKSMKGDELRAGIEKMFNRLQSSGHKFGRRTHNTRGYEPTKGSDWGKLLVEGLNGTIEKEMLRYGNIYMQDELQNVMTKMSRYGLTDNWAYKKINDFSEALDEAGQPARHLDNAFFRRIANPSSIIDKAASLGWFGLNAGIALKNVLQSEAVLVGHLVKNIDKMIAGDGTNLVKARAGFLDFITPLKDKKILRFDDPLLQAVHEKFIDSETIHASSTAQVVDFQSNFRNERTVRAALKMLRGTDVYNRYLSAMHDAIMNHSEIQKLVDSKHITQEQAIEELYQRGLVTAGRLQGIYDMAFRSKPERWVAQNVPLGRTWITLKGPAINQLMYIFDAAKQMPQSKRIAASFAAMMGVLWFTSGVGDAPIISDLETVYNTFADMVGGDSLRTLTKEEVTNFLVTTVGASPETADRVFEILDRGPVRKLTGKNLGTRNSILELFTPISLQAGLDVTKELVSALGPDKTIAQVGEKLMNRYFTVPARAVKAARQLGAGVKLDNYGHKLGPEEYGLYEAMKTVLFGDDDEDVYARNELFRTGKISGSEFDMHKKLVQILDMGGIESLSYGGRDLEGIKYDLKSKVMESKPFASKIRTLIVEGASEGKFWDEAADESIDLLKDYIDENEDKLDVIARKGMSGQMHGINLPLKELQAQMENSIKRYTEKQKDAIIIKKILRYMGYSDEVAVKYDNMEYEGKKLSEYSENERPYYYALIRLGKRVDGFIDDYEIMPDYQDELEDFDEELDFD